MKTPEECEECGDEDGDLYLHSKCHENSPTWAKVMFINKVAARIAIECAECEKTITILHLRTDNPFGEKLKSVRRIGQ